MMGATTKWAMSVAAKRCSGRSRCLPYALSTARSVGQSLHAQTWRIVRCQYEQVMRQDVLLVSHWRDCQSMRFQRLHDAVLSTAHGLLYPCCRCCSCATRREILQRPMQTCKHVVEFRGSKNMR